MRCWAGWSPSARAHKAWQPPLTKGLPSDHWKSPSMVRSFKPIHWYSLYWSGGHGVCWRQGHIQVTPVRRGLKGCWRLSSGRFGTWGGEWEAGVSPSPCSGKALGGLGTSDPQKGHQEMPLPLTPGQAGQGRPGEGGRTPGSACPRLSPPVPSCPCLSLQIPTLPLGSPPGSVGPQVSLPVPACPHLFL